MQYDEVHDIITLAKKGNNVKVYPMALPRAYYVSYFPKTDEFHYTKEDFSFMRKMSEYEVFNTLIQMLIESYEVVKSEAQQ